jgi:hypothetical protein
MPHPPLEPVRIVFLRPGTLAAVFAALGALGLFAATSGLLVKGGQDVGKHLQLLRHYLPGYTVTWPGALLGLVYGAGVGALMGAAIARLYNAVARRRRPQ